jgi:hypothetical protein
MRFSWRFRTSPASVFAPWIAASLPSTSSTSMTRAGQKMLNPFFTMTPRRVTIMSRPMASHIPENHTIGSPAAGPSLACSDWVKRLIGKTVQTVL